MRDDWKRFACVLSCLLASISATDAADAPREIAREFIYEQGPTPQCHATTIVETRSGTIAAAWFGGKHEQNPDVGIWFSVREDSGWTPPVEVANGVQYKQADGSEHRHPCWNPVLFQPSKGPLLLFYKCGPSPSTWWGMLMESTDDGATWSQPRRLPEGIDGPVKNKPIELADGTILCGSSTEHDGWRVHFELTKDLGRTWTRSVAANDGREIGAIQPSILRHDGNLLQAIGRSRQGKLWTTWSRDQGLSWEPLTLTELPNPNSGTDAVTLADGRHLLIYNNTPKGRSPLNVAISTDGKRWNMVHTLEQEPGEYSYPAVIQTKDGRVHVVYTWKRLRPRHVVLDVGEEGNK